MSGYMTDEFSETEKQPPSKHGDKQYPPFPLPQPPRPTSPERVPDPSWPSPARKDEIVYG